MADYQTLANIAAPRMMPNSPEGAGGIAGWMYGGDMARQDQLLAQAQQQAKIQAEMEAMKAGELTLAQPGRLANIETENAKATDTRDAYKESGRVSTFNDFKNKIGKQGEEEIKQAMPFLQALAKTTTDEETADVMRSGSQMGNTTIKGMDISKSMPPAAARKFAKMLVDSAIESVPQMQKERLEGIKGDNRVEAILTKGMTEMQREQFKTKARQEYAQLKTTKPDEWKNLYDMYPGTTQEDAKARYQAWLYGKTVPTVQQGQNTLDALRSGVPTTTPNILTAPTQVIKAPPAVAPKAVGAKPTPTIGSIWQDAKGKGKILGIKRDATGNVTHLNVEGLGIVEFK
jgi:hypothetical protein